MSIYIILNIRRGKMKKVLMIVAVFFIGVPLMPGSGTTYAYEENRQETAVQEDAALNEEEEAGQERGEEGEIDFTEESVEYRGYSPDQPVEEESEAQDEEPVEYRGFRYE